MREIVAYTSRHRLLNKTRWKIYEGEAFRFVLLPREENRRKEMERKKDLLVEIRPRRETAKAFAGQEGLLITVRDG